MPAAAVSRRDRRRQDTVEEILATALDVMAETGAAGLSLGEVARRIGMQTPSLYQYFESKNALYDALFARGWQSILDETSPYEIDVLSGTDPLASFTHATDSFVRWAVERPAQAQLMFWRPVPGYAPSEAAYAPAVACMERLAAHMRVLVERGVLASAAAEPEAMNVYTTLISGVISQQLSNEPGVPYGEGTFAALVPALTTMFFDRYRSRP